MARNAKIDFARCCMNYLIVLLHAWAAFQYVKWGCLEFFFWDFVCNHLCWLALPCFFMISGYLLFYDFSLETWSGKMKRRVKRLAVPYVVWNLTFVIFYLLMARFIPRLAARVSSFGLDTVAGASARILSLTVHPIDGPLWFLRSILVLSLLSPIMFVLMRKWNGIVALCVCCGWVVAESVLGLSGQLEFTFPSYAICCFVSGGILAVHKKDIVGTFKSKAWLGIGFAACVIRAVVVMVFCTPGEDKTIAQTLPLEFLAVLEAPFFISIVASLDCDRICERRLYVFCERISFFVYAGHFLVCSSIMHFTASLSGVFPGKLTVMIFVFVGCGVPILAVLYCIGEIISPRLLRLWNGHA